MLYRKDILDQLRLTNLTFAPTVTGSVYYRSEDQKEHPETQLQQSDHGSGY